MSGIWPDLRNRHIFFLDFAILLVTPTLSLALRLDTFSFPQVFIRGLVIYTVAAIFIRLATFYLFGLYRHYWLYASIEDAVQIALAVLTSSAVLALLMLAILDVASIGFARSVLIIDAVLVLLATGGTRFLVRLSRNWRRGQSKDLQRILVYGAGNTGSSMVREMQSKPDVGLYPVAFLDDNPKKHNMRIYGVPILGGRENLASVIRRIRIDSVVIALPSARGEFIREIANTCDSLQVGTKIVPDFSEMLTGNVQVNHLRDVAIQDLLRRDVVETDIDAVRGSIAGTRVLVTGGGGSIGAELCRQILFCHPEELVIVGHGENSVFEVHRELRNLAPAGTVLTPVIADTRFPQRIRSVFEQFRPQIVFHAAAHKHVALMESNPGDAVTNNVLGTKVLLNAALESGVERFVMISTDKAVNPVSIMGASKRVAELMVRKAAGQSGRPYVVVRFGNVLGSRGSVVLTFKRQIADGGPVTVTDPEASRYFMTIPEAVQLVLQAAVLGKGGEIFVLDMGEPVRISELARDMIRLSGLTPGTDIAIEYIGLQPGEKISEELFADCEEHHRTGHRKILVALDGSILSASELEAAVEALIGAARQGNREATIQYLKAIVPEYKPA